ncbi:MAG: helix-turn-helix transcriptional regulator [Gemmatimonadota bacterium]
MSHTFGVFLRAQRLKAGYGLREFAREVGLQPSNLSNIEHERIPPPVEKQKLERIASLLGLTQGAEEWSMLFDLAVQGRDRPPVDVAEFAAKTPGIPMLLRTIEEKRLTQDELTELMDYVDRIRRPAQ